MQLSDLTKLRWCLLIVLGWQAVALSAYAEAAHEVPPPQSMPALATPALSGPHAVGRRQYVWTDSNRSEMGIAAPAKPRRLVVWIWYPTAPSDARPSPVLPSDWSAAFAPRVKEFAPAAVATYLARRVHAVDDAPVSSAVRTYPVVLFMPGFGWLPTDYSYLIENLVSRGYIVAGVNPTGFVQATLFPDGENIPRSYPQPRVSTDYDNLVRWWVDDALFVRARLAALNAGADDLLAGRLDLERLGMFGHSFGGATTGLALAEDARFRAGINLDGGFRGSVIETGVEQPFMTLNSHSDANLAAFEPAERARIVETLQEWDAGWNSFARASPRSCAVTIRRTHHLSYGDLALLPSSLKNPQVDQPAAGWMDSERALKLISDYVNSFFDVYLKSDGAAPWQLPSAAPEVSIECQQQR